MLVGHSCIAYSFLAKWDIHTFLAHALLYSQHIWTGIRENPLL